MDLNGKSIVLTGASSGIGLEVLNRLIKYDADIIAVSRNIDKIHVNSSRVLCFPCDVSNEENVDKLFDFAVKKFGRIDIFIANAGFAYCEDLSGKDWSHIQKIYDTNVISPLYSFEKLKKLNRGRSYMMVITCSAVSRVALPGYSLYCSTKAAVDTFAKVYRFEANDQGRLSLVYPIATKTNFFNTAADKAPVPWPVQPAAAVADRIIKGIQKDKKSIYPSKAYPIMNGLNRVFPFIYHIYSKVQARKFDKWRTAAHVEV